MKRVYLFYILILLFGFLSCVSYPSENSRIQYQIPKQNLIISYTLQVPLEINKRNITNEIKRFSETNSYNLKYLGLTVNESGEFYDYSSSYAEIPDGDKLYAKEKYHLNIYLGSNLLTNKSIFKINSLLSFLTLYIIPLYASDNLVLTVDVLKNDIFIKRYIYQEKRISCVQVFLFPASIINPQGKSEAKAFRYMFEKFTYDANTDKVFQ